MTKLLITTVAALALAGPAFAKAHDQGIADGETPTFMPGAAAGAVDNIVRGDGRDASGALAAERRTNKGGNRTEPDVDAGKKPR